MELDLKKIANAWWDSYFGPSELKELAQARLAICEECPSRKVAFRKLVPFPQCGECGCPIGKKVFSYQKNDCPLKKWEEVDENSEYFYKVGKKTLL